MLDAKQDRQTRIIELVETHNIAKSIRRIKNGPGWGKRWERSLYHALSMAFVEGDVLERVRVALKLP